MVNNYMRLTCPSHKALCFLYTDEPQTKISKFCNEISKHVSKRGLQVFAHGLLTTQVHLLLSPSGEPSCFLSSCQWPEPPSASAGAFTYSYHQIINSPKSRIIISIFPTSLWLSSWVIYYSWHVFKIKVILKWSLVMFFISGSFSSDFFFSMADDIFHSHIFWPWC